MRLTTAFELRAGGKLVTLPHALKRIVAFLALPHRPVDRSTLAGALWLDVPQGRANASLRSALWRFGRVRDSILLQGDEQLALAPDVQVDVDDLTEACVRIATGLVPDDLEWLPKLLASPEILPTWDEEWLLAERERYRQLRLHALVTAGETLLARGEYGVAIDAGLAALQAEPLLETAHRLVVKTHMREGNVTEAIRQYRGYERLLMEDVGIFPSAQIRAIFGPLPAERH